MPEIPDGLAEALALEEHAAVEHERRASDLWRRASTRAAALEEMRLARAAHAHAETLRTHLGKRSFLETRRPRGAA